MWRAATSRSATSTSGYNALREAEANLRAAQAALQAARLNLDYTQVRAPITGRVGRLEVTVGNLVAAGAGAPVLTTLVSVDPIYAGFDADERIVLDALATPAGRAGSRAISTASRCRWRPRRARQRRFTGQLQLVDNQVDAASGTVRVRAVFDNPDGTLMPGQFARLRMGQARAEPALLINERAVGTDQNKKFVIVVGDDNKAAYREVHARRRGRRPARRDQRAGGRRADRRQRPAARPPGRAWSRRSRCRWPTAPSCATSRARRNADCARPDD